MKELDTDTVNEIEELDEEVKTGWTDQIFLKKLLDSLKQVQDAGAKYVRCLDCTAKKVDIYNITDIQFTSSLLDPTNKAVTKVCIIFDNSSTKPCETVQELVDLLGGLMDKIEENNKNTVTVSFALKDPSEKQFKNYRFYYDDANDTVLLAVNVPQIKLIQNYCQQNPGYGTAKQLQQITQDEVDDIADQMQADIDDDSRRRY